MSLMGSVIFFVFIQNALFSNAFGIRNFSVMSMRFQDKLSSAAIIAVSTTMGTIILWGILTYILLPLGIPMILPLLYILVLFPLFILISGFWGRFEKKSLKFIVFSDMGSSCLCAGIIISISLARVSFIESIFASVFSSIGYLIATVIVDSIKRRLELENVPFFFRGMPIILLSIGLISMAFLTIDMALVGGLVTR